MTRMGLLIPAIAILFCAAPALSQDTLATKAELEEVKGELAGMSESAAEYRGFVDALRKIKVSGYVQAQYRSTDLINTPYSVGNYSGGAFPANVKNLFQIRRGRVKINYDNTLTQYVLQIDAIQTGLALKDAYVAITEPWLKSFGLQMGVFDRPFGYEISYSSSSRETPERSRLFQTIFPGERELGAKVFYAPPTGPLSNLRVDLGVANGSGPTANDYDNFKDIIGHVSYQIPLDEIGAALDLGASGYFGAVRNATRNVYTPGSLPNGEPGFTLDSAAANLTDGVKRTYFGFDAQFYYDLPVLGGTILRFEYIGGKQPATSATSASASAQPAGALYQRDFSGWYAYLVQNVGNRDQIVLKYDVYDPNTKVSGSDFSLANTTGAAGLTATDMKYSTLGFGLVHHWDDNVKFVLYYEIVNNEKLDRLKGTGSSLALYGDDVQDNVFTFRMQVKF